MPADTGTGARTLQPRDGLIAGGVGAPAAAFLAGVVSLLEAPERLE